MQYCIDINSTIAVNVKIAVASGFIPAVSAITSNPTLASLSRSDTSMLRTDYATYVVSEFRSSGLLCIQVTFETIKTHRMLLENLKAS